MPTFAARGTEVGNKADDPRDHLLIMMSRKAGASGKKAACCIGVTTYIKDTLRKGIVFCRPRIRDRRQCHAASARGSVHNKGGRKRITGSASAGRMGLALGRSVDRAFLQLIRRNPDVKMNDAGRRATQVMCALKARGLMPVAGQITVAMEFIGIKTSVDGVFRNTLQGKTVIVELKATMASLDEHRRSYDVRCNACPTLSTGESNTERNAHLIQCGFGVLAHPKATSGIVAVSCRDGVELYDTSSWCMQVRLFSELNRSTPQPAVAPQQLNAWTRVPKWPGERATEALGRIRRRVISMQLNGRVATLDNGGAAVALRVPPSKMTKRMHAACKSAFSATETSVHLYIVCPVRGKLTAYKYQL